MFLKLLSKATDVFFLSHIFLNIKTEVSLLVITYYMLHLYALTSKVLTYIKELKTMYNIQGSTPNNGVFCEEISGVSIFLLYLTNTDHCVLQIVAKLKDTF